MMRPIRIEPGVQFDGAFVGLFDYKGERVIIGLRRFAHRAGEIFGPRLDLGWIESVARGSALKDQRIEFELSCAV